MKVINGNNIEVLKQYPDNYFDAIVTDPPYGLGKEPNAEELMKDWIEKGYHEISGTGFMGKEWDAFIPQPVFWKEVFRVLKHGGHVLSFFGTRTYDWGVMSMRFAGFEVRDCIQWLYGSGFPKSHSVSKAIDKMNGAEREVVGKGKSGSSETHLKTMYSETKEGKSVFGGEYDITTPSTDQAKQWDGWGSALKPANEPIVLARKPLEKGLSIAENVLKWGTGAINIDGCRVGFSDNVNMDAKQKDFNTMGYGGANDTSEANMYNSQGRFPANLILTHHEDCECVGTKKVKAISGGKNTNIFEDKIFKNIGGGVGANAGGLGDENGEETIEDWNCVDDCPIKILDEQSGESKSIRSERGKGIDGSTFKLKNGQTKGIRGHSDKGGASRFFYVAKASKSERNKGLDGFEEKETNYGSGGGAMPSGNENTKKTIMANIHPTVKPIKLMQYLVRLITPPNGIVLDPFCGSGTTGVACKLEGVQFVGLEQDAEYCKIAQARIDNYTEELPKKPKSPENNTDEQLNIFEL